MNLPAELAAIRMLDEKRTPGEWYAGAQNDVLYIIVGERPAQDNDFPRHDAKREAIAKLYDSADGVAEGDHNAAFIAAAPRMVALIEAQAVEIERLKVCAFQAQNAAIEFNAQIASLKQRLAEAAWRPIRWISVNERLPRVGPIGVLVFRHNAVEQWWWADRDVWRAHGITHWLEGLGVPTAEAAP